MPAVFLAGRIYVPGGIASGDRTLTTMDVYDPATDRWTTTTIPAPRHHHGGAAVNGKLYVIGGYSGLDGWPNWPRESTVFEFDPTSGSWTTRAPLPHPLAAMAVAVYDARIYVFGGASPTEQANTYIYDPAIDSWSVGAPMPTAREHVGAATIGSSIYVVGGRRFGSGNFRTLEAYSPESNTWRTLAPLEDRARSGHGVAAMNGRLYVFGGESFSPAGVFVSVEEYDPAVDLWRNVAPLPSARHGAAAVGLGSEIHVIGALGPSRGDNLVFRLP